MPFICRWVFAVGATLALLDQGSMARADIIWLKDGTRLDGDITYSSPSRIHIRTGAGLVFLNTADIRKREVSPPPQPLDPADDERRRKQIRAYAQQIAAIKKTYLDVGRSTRATKLFEQGAKLLTAIQDPLVIGPLTKILSEGNVRTRRLLVDRLDALKEDEATMNLVVITVLDPNESVRTRATQALLSRPDPRVVDDLRAALNSDEDEIVRNAAVALGTLRARAAANDLVDLLSFTRKMTITLPRGELLAAIQGSYIAGLRYKVAPGVAQAEPIIGAIHQGTQVDRQQVRVRKNVKVFRTEVQEALIQITGRNFGFDRDAGRLWLAQNPMPNP